jgi:pSer/pThr/pTyr-binding forkhead associated (FHA) protein
MAETNAMALGELAKQTVPRNALSWAADASRVVLVLTSGDQTPQLVDFGSRPHLTVGRAEPADVCVADPGVSRLHVRFTRESNGLRVIDLRSRNGTWVRGIRITEALLTTGDSVVIGNTSVLIQAVSATAMATPAEDASLADLGIGDRRNGQGINLRESLREHEAKLIREALRTAHGNQRRAAALLELPLRTFERKLRNMNLRQQAAARIAM